jgi:hypothetical protein
MPRAKSSSETFDALYDELTRERANEASEASTSTSLKSPNVAKDLRELVERVRIPRAERAAPASELDVEEDETFERAFEAFASREGGRRRKETRREDAGANSSPRPRALETPETLLRLLREEQRARARVEMKLDELEADRSKRDAEAWEAVEDARSTANEWRERCKQLRRDVPERWLGVFESYDDEIDRLGKENFALRECRHLELAERLSANEVSDANEESPRLRRALRAVTLERDAVTVKLADVARRERQMSLIKRHAEGVSARLARVERLLVSERASRASSDARARVDVDAAAALFDAMSAARSTASVLTPRAARPRVERGSRVARRASAVAVRASAYGATTTTRRRRDDAKDGWIEGSRDARCGTRDARRGTRRTTRATRTRD